MKSLIVCAAMIFSGFVSMTNEVDARQPGPVKSFQEAFAACIVSHDLSQARQFVFGRGAPPLDRRCLGDEWSQASFRGKTYRYALAKALLQRDYPEGLPQGISRVDVDPAQQFVSPRTPASDAERQRFIVADCVVRKEPAKSFALVDVEAGEANAAPAMAQLASTVAGCAAGVQLRYPTGFEMHEAIVTRMYQLAYAARKPRNA